jgi:thiol-disulfide isomerase/thioredoxin
MTYTGTVYKFWSPTCGPCKFMSPTFDDLKEEFSHLNWVSVNTHDDPNNFARQFGVNVVPTMVAVVSDSSKIIYSEKHSGTSVAPYYRILRNASKFIQQ